MRLAYLGEERREDSQPAHERCASPFDTAPSRESSVQLERTGMNVSGKGSLYVQFIKISMPVRVRKFGCKEV